MTGKNGDNKLVQQFIEFANKQVEASEPFVDIDPEVANKYWENIDAIFVQIKQAGNTALNELRNVLHHKDIGVRLWAASYLIHYFPEEVKVVLEEIAKSEHYKAFSAQILLEEWETGKLEKR